MSCTTLSSSVHIPNLTHLVRFPQTPQLSDPLAFPHPPLPPSPFLPATLPNSFHPPPLPPPPNPPLGIITPLPHHNRNCLPLPPQHHRQPDLPLPLPFLSTNPRRKLELPKRPILPIQKQHPLLLPFSFPNPIIIIIIIADLHVHHRRLVFPRDLARQTREGLGLEHAVLAQRGEDDGPRAGFLSRRETERRPVAGST